MNNGPMSKRGKIQVMMAALVLAWATQLLLHQWGYGADIAPTSPTAAIDADSGAQKFVPASSLASGAQLELRNDAVVAGGEVRLRQLCRWSDADAAAFAPVADLVVARVDVQTSYRAVELGEVETVLSGAGINLGAVRFCGPLSCTVYRSDSKKYDQGLTLDQWIRAKRGPGAAGAPAPVAAASADPSAQAAVEIPVAMSIDSDAPGAIPAAVHAPATRPSSAARAAAVRPEAPPTRSLRSLLVADASVRLEVPAEQLQLDFNPKDQTLLGLIEPQFRFNVAARQVRGLGTVSWDVTIVADGGATRVASVVAQARAWEEQVVVDRPISYRQLIRDADLVDRRVLVDRLADEPLLTRAQAVGEQAARDLKPGMVLNGRMVDAVPLARPGQLVAITAAQGRIRINTVARALEGGSFGQTIHVKNDATGDSYDVVLTGPQQGRIGP